MLYYLDTSIWLDIFENRDEHNFPKSKYAIELLNKIIDNNDKILVSRAIIKELINYGYNYFEAVGLFKKFKPILIYVNFNEKQFGKAKDIANKRAIPRFDSLHAIIARDNGAILISRDNHFKKLADITKTKKPEDII
ncbi:PIN domain-containing protein [Candidatus Woesearchaeota archaeon]|nr:PIN domain-containing protein [Candidatus Woesearchaeota archaeon]